MTEKQCTLKCKRMLPLDAFRVIGNKRQGGCRKCENEERADRRKGLHLDPMARTFLQWLRDTAAPTKGETA